MTSFRFCRPAPTRSPELLERFLLRLRQRLHQFILVPSHKVQYVRVRTAFDDVPIRRADVAVIQFFYDTSHVATSFGRDN